MFIYFTLISRQRRSSQRDMWPRKDKGEEEGQRPSSIGPLKQMKSVALHGALSARLGGRSTPLTKIEMTRKEENNLTLSSTHLFSFPGYPLVHSGRVCRLHPFRQPSSSPAQTILRNGQTAFPTWDWLTIPGHPRGSSLPTPPSSPTGVFRLKVYVRCVHTYHILFFRNTLHLSNGGHGLWVARLNFFFVFFSFFLKGL